MARALKACGERGCTELTRDAYCVEHAPEAWSGSRRRESTGSGWKQERRRRRIMAEHSDADGFPICHVCGKPGADQVDHVIPLAEGGPDSDHNCRPIHARPCHHHKTQAEAARARARARGDQP